MKAAAAAAALAKEKGAAHHPVGVQTEALLLRHERTIISTVTKAYPDRLLYTARRPYVPAPEQPSYYSNGFLSVVEDSAA